RFHQPDRKRCLLSLVNCQKDFPNIPIHGIQAKVRLPLSRVDAVQLMPNGEEVEFVGESDRLEFEVPVLETLRVLALSYA
ncbi:MAG: hypothetical protein KC931_03105, partial [Candidatus Omnitrophica bacterium]|nr:hypothetical protein [Candidatus Omnitrophota bacterium]